MMGHEIGIKIEGDTSPQQIRFQTLFEILVPFEKAVARVLEELDLTLPTTEAVFVPLSIESGSFVLNTVVGANVLQALQEFDKAFYAQANAPLLAARSEIEELERVLSKRHLSLGVSPSKSSTVSLREFTIAPEKKSLLPAIPSSHSTALGTVYGVCQNLHIANRTATVVLSDGRKVKLSGISDEHLRIMFRHMGERLEQVYRFDGMTTWSIETYHIEKMDVQSVRPVERDTKKLFLALKESTGNAFEGVSVVEQLKALRGEP